MAINFSISVLVTDVGRKNGRKTSAANTVLDKALNHGSTFPAK
ncbi:hypothetical protein PPEP_b0367 [Pseudoalteromonas peptidolytica F12-50-A1]|uniref:Uncharacterized protein n=1 Tax=Pseudoalteromonas peptidolytica F12-50-A1 TaxID=1315280 RepID=A0A8I0T606_9GAMM|nr:hypothetical protein [Pseudoalteromonas peptidolytica F12-50-A1]